MKGRKLLANGQPPKRLRQVNKELDSDKVEYPYVVEDIWNYVYIIDSDTKSQRMLNWINERFEIETDEKFSNSYFSKILDEKPDQCPRVLYEFVTSNWCYTSVWYKDMRGIPND